MLRYFARVCDWLGTVFAFLAPVCIIHWLLEATRSKALEPVTKPLDNFFHPLNDMFEPIGRALYALLHALIIGPVLGALNALLGLFGLYNVVPAEFPYEFNIYGHTEPMTQGLLGLAFTGLFFVCSLISQTLLTTEQKIDVTKKDLQQRARFEKIKAEQKRTERQALTGRNLLVYVQCNFHLNPAAYQVVEALLPHYPHVMHENTPDWLVMEFSTLENALNFSLRIVEHIVPYYRSLRPADPKPPVKIAIHAHPQGTPVYATTQYCQQLNRYAADNSAVFSQDVKSMMDASKLTPRYKFTPQGLYTLGGFGNQEVYRLVGASQFNG